MDPPAADGTLTLVRGGATLPAAKAERVLHFGDSMVPLVGNYLRPFVEKQGGKYEMMSTSSSSTLSWAEGDALAQAIAKNDPDLVLISLGSNELFFVDDLDQRGAAVRTIVDQVKGRPCLWVGPPSWAKAEAFLDVLKKNLGACQYFDSSKSKMERQEDGRHPTWGASYAWAMKVWARLGGEQPPTQKK